jgi:hypothetical protein
MWAVAVDAGGVLPGRVGVCDGGVGEVCGFGYHVDYIHAEATDAFVEPEAHVVVYGVAQLWVVPVEVWLFFGEDAKIELIGQGVVLPCAAFEEGLPVVGGQSGLDTVTNFGASFVPDVPALRCVVSLIVLLL